MPDNMLVKVCGMREPENIKAVAATGADWLGFIFYPRSSRYVEDGTSLIPKEITHEGRYIKKVGVFVDAPQEEMLEKAESYSLDYLQLHGNESPDLCYALQKRGMKVIKAFSVATADDLLITNQYEGRADYFLFDTRCEGYGGSGKTFDWTLLTAYQGETPFLLSGGLNPDSLEALKAFNHPRFAGIDLNSGFELAPAWKDAEALNVFVAKWRQSR